MFRGAGSAAAGSAAAAAACASPWIPQSHGTIMTTTEKMTSRLIERKSKNGTNMTLQSGCACPGCSRMLRQSGCDHGSNQGGVVGCWWL